VAKAFDGGLLTAASIMPGGDSFEEAVTLALLRPSLSIGLHITLCDGRAVLPHSRIPGLVREDGRFEKSPFRAGLRYWHERKELTFQIDREIRAQFERLKEVGIVPSHVDGHHHLHMHPVIFDITCRVAAEKRVTWIRVPREPLAMALRRGFRRIVPSLSEWFTFRMLSAHNLKIADQYGLKTVSRIVGLSRPGRTAVKASRRPTGGITDGRQCMTAGRDAKDKADSVKKEYEDYFCALLPLLKGSTNEVYAHPDLATEKGRRETEALESTNVREGVALFGISCTGYRQLLGTLSPRGPKEMSG
jgi:predicted glycoside hydrolase/deacetylase ChbG (UPF0249 family)